MQEREQKALSSTQRALELQQLAAGSVSPVDFSQLSAAAQRCTAAAEEAAQVASLARAEAANLADNGPALGVYVESPVLAGNGPALAGNGPALGLFANSPAPVPSTMAALFEGVLPSDESELPSTSLPAAEATDTAEAALHLRLSAQTHASSFEHLQRSMSSVDMIRGLSSDMQAAMQQLVASAAMSSSSAVLQEAEPETPSSVGVPSWNPPSGVDMKHEQGQGLPDLYTSNLAVSSSYQMPHLPDQASWQIPRVDTNPLLGLAAGTPTLPEQAPAENLGPSGMQIHLMHQLHGLERSVRRVEQQVSSTKQTRRRLKTASLPTQVTFPSLSLQTTLPL